MTLGYVEAAYRLPVDLTVGECAVLVCLAAAANKHGRCWPSQKRIAERVRLHPDTVKTTLRALATKGVIGKEPRTRENGSVVGMNVTLLFAPVVLKPTREGISPPQGENDPGGNAAPSGEAQQPALESISEPKETPVTPKGVSRRQVSVRARALAFEVRSQFPAQSRKRSSGPEMERAIDAALGRGASTAELRVALAAYHADPEVAREAYAYAKAPHRIVQDGRWREWLADPHAEVSDPRGQLPPAVDTDAIQARYRASWVERIERWRRDGHWETTSWGPAPDDPGCKAPVDLIAVTG